MTLISFGTFSIVKRATRFDRNPRTGEKIKIKSTKIPKFKPRKNLKNTVK
nr:HU family DNA-binding protein [Candidatus Profftella armatura (Diaphorina cf. continua)]